MASRDLKAAFSGECCVARVDDLSFRSAAHSADHRHQNYEKQQ
jgi:hypothetical protein